MSGHEMSGEEMSMRRNVRLPDKILAKPIATSKAEVYFFLNCQIISDMGWDKS